MRRTKDLSGKVYGRLRILGPIPGKPGEIRRYLALCQCGRQSRPRHHNLLYGQVKSCGCLRRQRATHALCGSPTYVSWRAMVQRTCNDNHHLYPRYSRLGICWGLRKSPAYIVQAIGQRPDGLTLDRIDNERGYHCGRCPECLDNRWMRNIRWADQKTQSRNSRNTHILEHNGERLCIAEWAERLGVTRDVITSRLRSGWPVSKALSPRPETIRDLAAKHGLSPTTLYRRLQKWPLEKALSVPVRKWKRRTSK